MSAVFEAIAAQEHEQVIFCQEPSVGYRCIIAIHSTALGPAVGGTRFWNYASETEALTDALRLSRGMTYKNAVADLPLGGGKAVLLGDNQRSDREALFRTHGRFVESLGGRFITAEDIGTSPTDFEYAARETRYVAGIAGRGGDPSPWTARGVLRGIQASAYHLWSNADLAGKTVAVQGCGNVGYALASLLHQAGARLIVSDTDRARVARCVNEFDATPAAPEEIHRLPADIFAPCALGGILNDRTIPQLQSPIVAGAANNQLLSEQDGFALAQRGILYAPDYVINAGGVISGSVALLGEDPESMAARVEGIYATLLTIYAMAAREGIASFQAADRLAEQRLQVGR